MAALAQGAPVYGQDFPPSQYDQDWTVQANIVSTSYTTGTPLVAVTQVAPSSGKIFVCIGAGVRNNAASIDRAEVSYQVYRDSADGILIQSAFDNYGLKSAGPNQVTQFHYAGNFSLLTGLVPGTAYYFQVVHRNFNGIGPGTVDIASRSIMTIPVP